jgi:hypothetical protein
MLIVFSEVSVVPVVPPIVVIQELLNEAMDGNNLATTTMEVANS